MAPAGAKNADLDSVRAALVLAAEAPSETDAFEQKLAADPTDMEARFELAKALAGRGQWQGAADHLLTLIEQDRAWNDEAARKQLLTVFEAAGADREDLAFLRLLLGGVRDNNSALFDFLLFDSFHEDSVAEGSNVQCHNVSFLQFS